jgi:transposase
MARTHNDEFKREAVRIALTSGLTRRQVASDLGIRFSTLAKWIQKSNPDDLPPTADIDLAKENERLRREKRLKRISTRISMDGKGRFLDNIFVERLWRSMKYECVYGPAMMAYHAASLSALGKEHEESEVLQQLKNATSKPGAFSVEGWLRRATSRTDYIQPLLGELENAKRLQ